MDDQNKKLLEEAIAKALENLDKEEIGSEEYSKRIADIRKLYELKIDEEKIDESRNSAAMQRGQDTEKMMHEEKLKKEETKQTIFKIGGDIGKTILTIGAYGIWFLNLLKFEENGTIHSKGWSFIGKPKSRRGPVRSPARISMRRSPP